VMDGDRVPAQYLRTPLPLYYVEGSRNSVDHAEKNSLVPNRGRPSGCRSRDRSLWPPCPRISTHPSLTSCQVHAHEDDESAQELVCPEALSQE
jgi:hypothetical protein